MFFGIFTPDPWGNDPIDEHIFQMGWFNHQLVDKLVPFFSPIGPINNFSFQIWGSEDSLYFGGFFQSPESRHSRGTSSFMVFV